MRRSEQRREAVFALYQHDVTGRPFDDLFTPNTLPFTRQLVRATLDHQDELDEQIKKHSVGWTLERIAPLERAILRVALLELFYPELVAGESEIPPEGAIEEAVETAKEFCGADAAPFVNGVLGASFAEKGQKRP